MIGRLLHSAAAVLVAAVVFTAPVLPAYGQQSSSKPETSQTAAQPQLPSFRVAISDRDYSRGRRIFPNVWGPYAPVEVPPPDLTNSPKIEQLIHEGKMELSLQDAMALALENNLDISLQRYTPWIAETDILRTLSGGAARGLAGTGTASVLGAIPVETFDPLVTSTLSLDHRNTPVNNPFLSGTGTALPSVTNHTITGNFGYSQAFHTGTGMAVTWNNNRLSTTSPATLFNPAVNSALFVSFTQQLLNGFGLMPNTRFIRIAKNNKKIADYQFSQQVITSVVQVSNQYWELVFARADVQVQQRAVEVAEKLYADNKRQVEIGTLAPIEVVRAEAEVARNRQNLIVSQTNQLQQQTLLKNLISKNPLAANLQDAEIIPTDRPVQLAQIDIPPLPNAVKEALEKRPDILQQRVDLLNREINVRATGNALLPVLSLFGQYGWSALAGNSRVSGAPTAFTANLNSPVVSATGTPTGTFTSNPVLGPSTLVSTGLTDAFDAIFNNNLPTYTLQLSLSIPIRNRSAQADSARARLERRQSETTLRRLQNNVVVEVRNAEIALEQNRARVEAATKARILQEQTLDAEQKKFQLGASTIFFVIQAQRDLATAQDAEIRALVDLLKSKIDFERALGRTLEVNRITIADAKGGRMQPDTLIPGTVSGEVIGTGQTY
ncbi:MAG TPA: TolC family protein [Candidatus Acidoferrales bacterium]|nr:TolC family protein [Candidatus Acidoferrales bacterium]